MEPMIMGMMHLVDSMGGMKTNNAQPPDTLWYNDDNSYWYAQSSGFDGDFGMSYYMYDSMQFVHGGVTAKWPDTATLTQINSGGWRLYTIVTADKEMAGDTGIYYSFVGNVAGAAGAFAELGDVTANGSGHLYFLNDYYHADPQLNCVYEIYDDFQSTNVQMNLYNMMFMGMCPEGGTTVHNAEVPIYCTGDLTIDDTDFWYLSETYAGDTVHYVVENSVYRWQFSEECYMPGK
jgi:hypothetical protein